MSSPSQADIVKELYSRKDSLPKDKQAVVEELYQRFNSKSNHYKDQLEELTKVKQSSNFLGGPIMMGPPGVAGGANVVSKLAAGGKAALAPKAGGRLAKFIEGFKSVDAVDIPGGSDTPGLVKKQALKYTPSREPTGSPARAPIKVKPSSSGSTAGDYTPELPGGSESPGGLKKQALKYTAGREPSGTPHPAPKITSSKTGGVPEAGEAKSALEASAEGYKPSSKLKQQLNKFTPGRQSGGGPARAPQKIRRLLAPEAEPATETEAPEKTSRSNRGTPEKQQQSDEIASLNRHADTVPLAQQAVKDGVTSKQLLELPPAARADFMKRIGLEGRSDTTWRTFVGHVLRLEKLAK